MLQILKIIIVRTKRNPSLIARIPALLINRLKLHSHPNFKKRGSSDIVLRHCWCSGHPNTCLIRRAHGFHFPPLCAGWGRRALLLPPTLRTSATHPLRRLTRGSLSNSSHPTLARDFGERFSPKTRLLKKEQPQTPNGYHLLFLGRIPPKGHPPNQPKYKWFATSPITSNTRGQVCICKSNLKN